MAELGTTSDPTALVPGSAEGAAGVAVSWRAARDAARQLSEAVFAVSPSDSWTGEAAEAFESRRTAAADAWAATADSLAAAADAAEAYAATLGWAQLQAAEAIALWEAGQQATVAAQAERRATERTASPTTILPPFVDAGESSRTAARDLLAEARAELARAGDAAAAALRGAEQLAPEEHAWALFGVGASPLQIFPGTPKAVTDKLLLSVLGRLSRADPEQIEELLELHPEWADMLDRYPPEPAAVNAWWDSISDPAVQQALVLAAPAVIGSLGGVPPLFRVAANRENAADRLDQIDEVIADPSTGDAERDALEAERSYLQRAVDDKVQLYLYEPATHSIIELIGTPSAQTTTTLTYVPGTFTTMESFYASDGGVQEVPRWLQKSDPNVVAFVWKEGVFPGEGVEQVPSHSLIEVPAIKGLLEANDPRLAAETGGLLAEFQAEMQASQDALASSEKVGMGHSWGLVPITASEGAAHYDQVHSLAGAGMPADWSANPNTSYHHWAYTDALTMAQETGAVWDGNIPARDPAFESEVFARDSDFDMRVPTAPMPGTYGADPPLTIPATSTPVESHNLIGSDEYENQRALREILRRVGE
jgi:hypothetical protein